MHQAVHGGGAAWSAFEAHRGKGRQTKLDMMPITIRQAAAWRAIIIALLLALPLFLARADELAEFLREAELANPQVQAASWRVEQAMLKHQELLEFLDPSLYGAVGLADNIRSIPASTGYTSLTSNSAEAQLGVQIPIPAGAYVSLGSTVRVLDDVNDYDYLYQNLFGVKVRIPLLRDRAFRQLSISRARALAEYNATAAALLRENQTLRHEVELAYIAAYETWASFHVTKAATARFQALLEETQELCRLKVVPEYQINQALLELQIGKEDEEKARNNLLLTQLNLQKAIGNEKPVQLKIEPTTFFLEALQAPALISVPLEQAYLSRGNYLVVLNNIKAIRASIDGALEDSKDDVSLNFGMTVMGESENHPFGSRTITTDHNLGGEVTVVWSRSIDYRGPKARQARHEANIRELNEELRTLQIEMQTQIRHAELNYQAAVNRLQLVNHGIAAAQDTVAAEQERFRLGESTSKNVTDAQKNLTTILHRQTTAAADLLRARANYLYAIGYNEETVAPDTPPQQP